ncbi:TPA: IS3 family transposase [Streptococcus pyogenes]
MRSRKKKDDVIELIEQLCMENHFIYGYRTITRLLKKIHGLTVNTKKVYRIMKNNGWLCWTRTKKVPNLGKAYYLTDNKLSRDFHADKPIEKLVTDITYLYFDFGNCKLYLSSIMDLYNREIIAYTISDCQDTDFVLDTLNQLKLPKEQSYTVTKAQCILLWLTTRLARKKALSAQCLEKEHLQIMPVLNGFTPS